MFVEVLIGSSKYKIPCKESQKEKLLKVVEKLEARVENLSTKLGETDDSQLLAMAALLLEEELMHKSSSSNDDIYDEMSDNMENLTKKVKTLTEKINDYQ